MFLILHNPLSSNMRSRHKTKKIVRYFKKNNLLFIIRSSLKINDLNAYLAKHPDITDILLLGGDGSINYFINSIETDQLSQNIYLAKSGSGNDFLRTLKPLKKANVTIGNAKTNHNTHIRFINGCGLGFDALVCYYVDNDFKKNKISYFLNVFRAIIHYKPQTFTVIVDGKEKVYHNTFFAAVQNGRFFGGGMKATPDANIEDDQFDVLIIHNIKKWMLQVLMISIYFGWHKHLKKYVDIIKGKDIIIQTEKPSYFQFDGEVASEITEIHINAHSKRVFHAFHKQSLK